MTSSLKFAELGEEYYSRVKTQRLENTHLIHVNKGLKAKLELKLSEKELLGVCTGEAKLNGIEPLSSVYAGHQFGYFVPQLGDGRSCLIGEANGYELSLKGAGTTPYSRGADGRAVLRSSIREYLCSIAMEGLNIPTTEALAIVASDTDVYREHVESGAIVTRVAKSHIRFGHFELFASRGQTAEVKKLADFVIDHYYPQLKGKDSYLQLFKTVILSTAVMIARWQAQGFAHGVMNSDNMSILGLTIDYGPFSFMETYNPSFICNHSDHQGRYSFERQPSVALWNLDRLANAIRSLIDETHLKDALAEYEGFLVKEYSALMRQKFGLVEVNEDDSKLVNDYLQLLYLHRKDYPLSMRILSKEDNHMGSDFDSWFERYHQRLTQEKIKPNQRQKSMDSVNPKYVLRNYLAEVAIRKAEDQQQFDEIDTLFNLLKNPFDEHKGFDSYTKEAPEWAKNLELSCSS